MNKTLIKTIIYETIATIVALFITYLFIGSWMVSVVITFTVFGVKLVLYYCYEKAWERYWK